MVIMMEKIITIITNDHQILQGNFMVAKIMFYWT